MKRSQIIAILIACALFTPLRAATLDSTWPWGFAGIDYVVQTAPYVDVKVEKEIDFDVYHFAAGGRNYLNAYVGNAPDFPMYKTETMQSRNQDPINGVPAETIIYKGSQGTKSRETLVTLRHSAEKWTSDYIHFFYSGDSSSDAFAADAVINSLAYVGNDPKLMPSMEHVVTLPGDWAKAVEVAEASSDARLKRHGRPWSDYQVTVSEDEKYYHVQFREISDKTEKHRLTFDVEVSRTTFQTVNIK
jgi:hypothetical protein